MRSFFSECADLLQGLLGQLVVVFSEALTIYLVVVLGPTAMVVRRGRTRGQAVPRQVQALNARIKCGFGIRWV